MPKFKEGERVRLLSIYKMPTEAEIMRFMENIVTTRMNDYSDFSIQTMVDGSEHNNPIMAVENPDFILGNPMWPSSTVPVLCRLPIPGGRLLDVCFPEHILEFMGTPIGGIAINLNPMRD